MGFGAPSFLRRKRGTGGSPATGPRPTRADQARLAAEAFAPKTYVLPPERRLAAGVQAGRATRQAVERIAKERGISMSQASGELIKVAGQIQKRDEILRESRRTGRNRLETLAALKKADIPTVLLKERSIEYVLPGKGTIRQTSLSGGPRRRTPVSAKPRPQRAPAPAPTATPSRRY